MSPPEEARKLYSDGLTVKQICKKLGYSYSSVHGWVEKITYKNLPEQKIIYFIKSENGLLKIGITNNIERRFDAFIKFSPCKLILLKTIHGSLFEEKHLHQQFSHLRQHGEWFKLTDELLNYINSL